MVAELNARGHPAIPLDLKRLDWLKITKSLPTKAYWDGTLQPKGTLDFYFEAAEAAVAEAKARFPDRKIHILAHSIGGWCVCVYVSVHILRRSTYHCYVPVLISITPRPSLSPRIARAYCGEVADPADVDGRFVSLTTLGSPHYPPKGEGFWAKADQTRGLLSYGGCGGMGHGTFVGRPVPSPALLDPISPHPTTPTDQRNQWTRSTPARTTRT